MTLLVHLDHDRLVDGLASARLDTGTRISVGEARRLACDAGILPAVLGGLESPPGALAGGLILGLALSYISGYAGAEVVTLGALVILVLTLMVRPSGLFAHAESRRV